MKIFENWAGTQRVVATSDEPHQSFQQVLNAYNPDHL